MFCAIPFPCHLWDEKARDKMLLFLPVVGLEMGALWALAAWACRWLGLSKLIFGLVVSLFPFVVSGYLHLDGFMDVTDAIGSCRSLERRREILKDSHVGAFAVIGIVLLVVSQFALGVSAQDSEIRILFLVPAVSRCCSALAVTVLPPMSTSQYADCKKNTGHLAVLVGMLVCFTAAGFLLWGKAGVVLLGCMAGYGLALRKAYRALEGMNGDISGYCLTIAELCALAVLALM
jgi:adenosylcobinamide-GDP ribazoletransferase